MDQDFMYFLQERRHLDKDAISIFVNEKIDCYAVNGMSDDQLMKYVPKFGDRVAIRQYCRREVASLEGPTTNVSKATEHLMEKIKQRQAPKRRYMDERSDKLLGNSNATKNTRTYQIGLFEEVIGSFVQVRERRGGGTRHLKAPRSTTMDELMKIAKDLFFPNGKSKLGNIHEFEFTMRDFTEDELDQSTTLGQLYEVRKVKLLRLYLSCKRTNRDVGETTTPCASQNSSPHTQSDTHCADADLDGTPSKAAYIMNIPTSVSSHHPTESVMASETLTASQYLLIGNIIENEVSASTSLCLDEGFLVEDVYLDDNASVSFDDEIQIGGVNIQNDNEVLDDTLPMEMDTVHGQHVTAEEPHHQQKITRLRVRRGNVFHDLNTAFKDGAVTVEDMLLEIEMVLPNGTTEKGEDNGGVLRDAISEYWETFILKCTTGNTLKIPMTRHDMKDEWENVAKVLVIGYNMLKYFPIALAKPFLSYCLHLEIMDDELLATFLATLPTEEKETADQAIKDFKTISGREEWFDFLKAHDIKCFVTESNVRKTLLEVAHKEMVQDPAYIAECWSSVLKGLHLPPGGLDEVMASLNPTTRKVVAMLQHDTLTKREYQILDFLKKFIRTCSEVRLRKFLRFCTGADLLVAKHIHVRFVEPKSTFTTCPQSHTCGCVLEVPNSYVSYLELAEDLTSVLDANMWVMDII